jgi:hypothetical protein
MYLKLVNEGGMKAHIGD